ncbi:MAG: glycolate oxidase subunit GlcE [Rhizomicrobium sp.]|jgi:glycolate oxidase FAD binding subunit
MTHVAIEAELVEAVRAARQTREAFEIVGRGTKRAYGRAMAVTNTLDVSALSGILDYEHDELVITARAATPISEIEAALNERQQRLGFDPADWGPLFGARANAGTIGGALSADTGGPARLRFGSARDHLLGYRAVNGFGEAYKAGGRVVKNVTGFDLSKLMCGAMGTLGVLTEVTLRVYPRAPASATLIVRDIGPEEGLALLRRAWSSPFELTGLAYIPDCAANAFGLGECGKGAALMRVEGAAEPLKEKIAALRVLLGDCAVERIDDGEAIFAQIGAGAPFLNDDCDVWRLSVPQASAAACIDRANAPLWFADWAGGLLWLGAPASSAPVLRAIAARAGGHATLFRASAESRATIPVFQPEPVAHATLTKSVKAAFDPLALFNPGRMFEGV